MKKIIGLIYFFTILQAGSAQDKNDDTTGNSLQNVKDPAEKFSLIVKISENRFMPLLVFAEGYLLIKNNKTNNRAI